MSEKEHSTCFYCGASAAKNNIEMDHFPVPARYGGITTVPACLTCHGMKDRFRLDDWPLAFLSAVSSDFPKFNRETRIFLAKAASIVADAVQVLKERK